MPASYSDGMKLQQLRFFREVVERGFNISRAADALHTSQPGISRQIGLLEEELGVVLMQRSGNRLLGLSPAGVQVDEHVRALLKSVEAIQLVGQEFRDPNRGALTLATTHTHARYVLAEVIRKFARRYPDVRVKIVQGRPDQIAEWVRAGEATLGLATRPAGDTTGLAFVDCYEVQHVLIVPLRHELLASRAVTLAQIAKYPLIGYDDRYQLARYIEARFEGAGLSPNIMMRASDSDVIKTYVAAGLGVAVIPTLAYSAGKDRSIRSRSLGKAFAPTVACAILRSGLHPRAYLIDFLRLLSPKLTESAIKDALLK